MLPLQMDRVAEHEAAPRNASSERIGGALFLTSLGMATIAWCLLLALALWKATHWIFEQAP